MEFAETKKKLDAIGAPSAPEDKDKDDNHKRRRKSKGRRDLSKMTVLREERIELVDDELEAFIRDGKAERIGFETSYRLGYQRAGAVRVVVARATYKTIAEDQSTMLFTVPRPRELLRRCLLAPSLLAHFIFAKCAMGLPLFRLESWLGKEGISLDRGPMSRWAEDLRRHTRCNRQRHGQGRHERVLLVHRPNRRRDSARPTR